MAKAEKEKCPRCGSEDFSVALKNDKPDPSGKRYCKKCQHVWSNQTAGMSRLDITISHLQTENNALKEALNQERATVKKLKEQLDALKPKTDEDEIFT